MKSKTLLPYLVVVLSGVSIVLNPNDLNAGQTRKPSIIKNLSDVFIESDCRRLLAGINHPHPAAILHEVKTIIDLIPLTRFQRAAITSKQKFPKLSAKAEAVARQLALDPNIEMMLPFPGLVESLSEWIGEKNHVKVAQLKKNISEYLVKVRELYYKKHRETPIFSQREIDEFVVNWLDSSKVEIQRFQSFSVYKLKASIPSLQLMKLLPLLDRAWPRPKSSLELPLPRVFLVELSDMPGTYIAHFNDISYMNAVFQRASAYIEFDSGIVSGIEIFGNVAGGHDLRGEALLRYWGASEKTIVQDKQATRGMNPSTAKTYLARLGLERDFFASIILPTIRVRGEESTVFLASTTDRGATSIVSHEVWHGKYFTDPNWAAVVSDYYVNYLSTEDKEAFKSAIQHVGYDPNDLDLMINEHQAYLLQIDSPYFLPTPLNIQMQKTIERLRQPFFEFLESKGYEKIVSDRAQFIREASASQ